MYVLYLSFKCNVLLQCISVMVLNKLLDKHLTDNYGNLRQVTFMPIDVNIKINLILIFKNLNIYINLQQFKEN